eukprot:5775-Pleurochrysis_carterae.AAC.2
MVDANGMRRKVRRCVRPRGGKDCACVPGKLARATPCCLGAQPAGCGIAEIEYGNPLDLRVIITHI